MPCNHRPTISEDCTRIECSRCHEEIGICVDHCQQWFTVSELRVINEHWACAEARSNFPVCAICGQQAPAEITQPDGSSVCRVCAARAVSCRLCNARFFPTPDGSGTQCPTCEKRAEELSKTTFTIIKVDRTIGLELEFLSSLNLQNPLRWGCLKGDGSVYPITEDKFLNLPPDTKYVGREFASFILKGDQLESAARETCSELTPTPQASYVNKQCGFHVHLGMKDISDLGRRRIRDWWAFYEPIFYSLVEPGRRTNKFCMPLAGNTEREGAAERYSALNTRAFGVHGTYEWRLHHGTLDPDEVVLWPELLLNFVHTHKDIPPDEVLKIASQLNMRNRLIMLLKQSRASKRVREDVVNRLAAFSGYRHAPKLRHFTRGIDLRKGTA